MKKVYIVGGSGFARECYVHLQHMHTWDPTVQFVGFLGNDGYGDTVDYKTYQKYYLGDVANHEFRDDEYVVIGIGYIDARRKLYNQLKARGVKFINLLTEPLLDSVALGEANVIVNSGALSANVIIGDGNIINTNIVIGHDVEMGDFNFLGPCSQLLGYAKIGSSNSIGAGAILLPHAKIGDNNKIAPLSAVYKGCRDNVYMLGNPAVKVDLQ